MRHALAVVGAYLWRSKTPYFPVRAPIDATMFAVCVYFSLGRKVPKTTVMMMMTGQSADQFTQWQCSAECVRLISLPPYDVCFLLLLFQQINTAD